MRGERYKYYELSGEEREALIEAVRRVLGRDDRVLLAVIFGSFVELESFRDIDIAVYAVGMELREIFELSARLEEEIKVPVDLLPLQELPPSFRHYILINGLVVLERVAGLYEALISQALDELMLMELAA